MKTKDSEHFKKTMISIVIVNWNSGVLLEKCVSSLREYASGCEIIVADNASSDNSADFLKGTTSPVLLIRNQDNIGFASAANLAWRHSRGESVLFLNPDTESFAGSVGRLEEPLRLEAGVWATGGLLLSSSGEPQTGFNVRTFPTLGSVAADMYLLKVFWPSNPWTSHYRCAGWNPGRDCDIYQPAGACLMVSRRALNSLGGFDERFRPAWFEDVDLCHRIWRAGGRIRFVSSARFLHLGGYSLGHLSPEAFLECFHTNQIRYFAKHQGESAAERVRKLAITGLYLRSVLSFLRPGRGNSRRAAARGFWRAASQLGALDEIQR